MKKLLALLLILTLSFSCTACSLDDILPDEFIDLLPDGFGDTAGSQDSDGSNNSGASDENKYSQYSQLLQNVLNNEEYKDLTDRSINEDDYDAPIHTKSYLAQHPYAFLEDQGFDVDAIKNSDFKDSRTLSYVLEDEPNNLYILTRILQNKDDVSYYHCFLIKYTLSDQEMADYHCVYEDTLMERNPVLIESGVAARCFMNNEISKMKTPTIVAESKVTVEAYESLTKSILGKSNRVITTMLLDITTPDNDIDRFKLLVIPQIWLYEENDDKYPTDFDCTYTIEVLEYDDCKARAKLEFIGDIYADKNTFTSPALSTNNSEKKHKATLYADYSGDFISSY